MSEESWFRRVAETGLLFPGFVTLRHPKDLVILSYHKIGEGDRGIDLPLEAFEYQLAQLASTGWVQPLDLAIEPGVGASVVVTIDDGYRDFYDHALPLLVRYQIPATLYLTTGNVTDDTVLEARRPNTLLWTQLEEALATGLVTIGAHTHSHRDLSIAPEAEVEMDLRQSKELIEDRLGVPCRHFAYPFDRASATAERLVRQVFASAAWTVGTNRVDDIQPYRLARVPILRGEGAFLFRTKSVGHLLPNTFGYRLLRRVLKGSIVPLAQHKVGASEG